MESITGTENERDGVKEEAQVAVGAGDVKARVEDDLARAQSSLATVEEAKRKVKIKTSSLEVEGTSVLLEIGAAKDEVCSLQS